MAKEINLTSGPDLWFPLIDPELNESVIVNSFEGNDTVLGTGFGDLIFGNQDDDNLDGAGGDDTVYGGQGNDIIRGTSGNNLILGNQGNDVLFTGTGNDTIYGGEGNDSISAQIGNNLLLGNQGDDTISSGIGDDTVYGGQGNDLIKGILGNNTLLGNEGNDTIEAGSGNDIVYGGQGNDLIKGNQGNNTLLGNEGNDIIEAGTGNDSIDGGEGDDVIIGNSSGTDTLNGGEGNDTLRVINNLNLSLSTTVLNIETFDIAEAVTLIASFDNLVDASVLLGNGTLQLLGTKDEVLTFVDALATVSENLTILDQDGQNVRNPDPGADATLTIGADVISVAGIINAPSIFVAAIGNTPTLESVDRIEGLGDDDTLFAIMNGTVFGDDPSTLEVVPIVTGVENISIRALGNDVIYNSINTTGVQTFISVNSPNTLSIENIQDLPNTLILRNSSGSLEATVADTILEGTSDSVEVIIDNVNGVGKEISIGSNGGRGGYETFNIVSTGAVINRLERITGDNNDFVETINISGNQDLELRSTLGDVVFPGATTINASQLDGNLTFQTLTFSGDTLTFTGGTGNVNFPDLEGNNLNFIGGVGNVNLDFQGNNLVYTGGEGNVNAVFNGNDAIFTGGAGNVDLVFSGRDLTYTGGTGIVNLDFSGRDLTYTGGTGDVILNMFDNLDADDIIDGGIGDNLITASFDGNVGPLNIKNVQTLDITTQFVAPANISFDKSDNSIELIIFNNRVIDNNQEAADITIDAIKSIPTLEFQGSGEAFNDESKSFSKVTILSTAVSAADNVLVLDINNQGVQLNNNTGYNFNGVQADAIENIEINITDGNLNFARNQNGELIDFGGIPGDIEARRLQTVTINSADSVRLGNIGNRDADTVQSIDVTAVAGLFEARSSDLGFGAVLNFGNGDTDFDASNSTENGIKFNGGTGDDTLIGSQGNDVIIGNAGSDLIDLSAGGSDLVTLNNTVQTDLITGFTIPDDKIGLSNSGFGTLSVGQKYNIISAAEFLNNVAENNQGSTVIQDNSANIRNLGNLTTRVRFVSVIGADVTGNATNDTSLFYSANGSFGNASNIGILDSFGGFNTGESTELIAVA